MRSIIITIKTQKRQKFKQPSISRVFLASRERYSKLCSLKERRINTSPVLNNLLRIQKVICIIKISNFIKLFNKIIVPDVKCKVQ